MHTGAFSDVDHPRAADHRRRSGLTACAAAAITAFAAGASLQASTIDEIDGLRLWLDATASGSVFADGDGLVSLWNDRRGNGLFAAAGGDQLPLLLTDGINDQAALRFGHSLTAPSIMFVGGDGASSIGQGVPAMTVFAVSQFEGHYTPVTTSAATLFRVQTTYAKYFLYRVGDLARDQDGAVIPGQYMTNNLRLNARQQSATPTGQQSLDSPTGSVVEDQPAIFVGTRDFVGRESLIYIDGELVAQADAPGNAGNAQNDLATYISIGGSLSTQNQPYRGLISELLVFERRLSDDEMLSVNTYLSEKWGVTLIPEPSSLLVLAGAAGMLFRRRRAA
jgi:hypothetical protein